MGFRTVSLKTPIYLLEYPEAGEPVRNTRGILERNAKAVESALASRAVAPANASDVATLAGRVTTLEAGRLLARAERFSSAGPVTNGGRALLDQLVVGPGQAPQSVAGLVGSAGVSFTVSTQTRVGITLSGKIHATASTIARLYCLLGPGTAVPGTTDANVIGIWEVPWATWDPSFESVAFDTLLAPGTYTTAVALSSPGNAVGVTLVYEAGGYNAAAPTAYARPQSSTKIHVRALGAA